MRANTHTPRHTRTQHTRTNAMMLAYAYAHDAPRAPCLSHTHTEHTQECQDARIRIRNTTRPHCQVSHTHTHTHTHAGHRCIATHTHVRRVGTANGTGTERGGSCVGRVCRARPAPKPSCYSYSHCSPSKRFANKSETVCK
jgi:hypothetical protein